MDNVYDFINTLKSNSPTSLIMWMLHALNSKNAKLTITIKSMQAETKLPILLP